LLLPTEASAHLVGGRSTVLAGHQQVDIWLWFVLVHSLHRRHGEEGKAEGVFQPDLL
jgi:hypothetical protein